MATISVQDDSLTSSTDDTGRHSIDIETLNDHTDQTPSTYDILGHALAGENASPNIKYSLATLWDAFESHSTMPGAHGGLKPWPDIRPPPRDDPLRNASHPQAKEQASTATMRAHYDSAQQPLSVSQQTSASSVRDMALRKGTTAVLRKEDKPASRPLKSALKRYPSEQREVTAHPQFLYPPEHVHTPPKAPSRLERFGNFFSKRSSSGRSNASPQVSRTPSAASTVSSNYTRPSGPRRQRSIGWDQPLQQYDTSKPSSDRSDLSDAVRQAKLAGDDVYEKAKTNIRRPPKGITNWFDGIDISSDEDLTPTELPSSQAIPSTFTTFEADPKPKQDPKHNRQKEHDAQLTKAERVLGQRTGVARYAPDTIDDKLLPMDRHDHYRDDDYFDRRATTPKASEQLYGRPSHDTSTTMTSFETDDVDTGGRPATASLYSSQSESHGRAAVNSSQRPQIPPRRLQNAQIATHNAYHVNEHPQLVSRNSASKYMLQPRRTEVSHDDHPSTTHKTTQRAAPASTRSRGRTNNRLSSIDYDDSYGNASLDLSSPDISHMMAVTEEEMALLEMMRDKRAAMQKHSYSEGYRQALKREHEQLMQRRMLAQQTALRILQTQQEQEIIRQHIDIGESDMDDKEIRRLHKLRQQEMDRSKRLEKFLAMDTSLAAALDDAGVPQDDLVQDWPIPKGDVRPTDARRSRKAATSFSRRDVYEEASKPRHDKRSRAANDANSAPLYANPSGAPHHKQIQAREVASGVRFGASHPQDRAHRKSQTYSKQTIEDAAYRQELYTMNSQSATRSSRAVQPTQQQLQNTTFLRSMSDYHPAEDTSITSEGSPSVSASIASPMTPSSTGGGPVGKLSGYDGLEVDYLNRSSPEMTFHKPTSDVLAARKKKQLPSALAILAESDRSSYRNSMASTNSAGEDVLAAWAELGGNEGMLPNRARRTRAL